MCNQTFRRYTCGCEKKHEFTQCQRHVHSNVLCDDLERTTIDVDTYCRHHLVKASQIDSMHRIDGNPFPFGVGRGVGRGGGGGDGGRGGGRGRGGA